MTFQNLCYYYVDCLKNDSINIIFSNKDIGRYCLPLHENGLLQSYSLSKDDYNQFLRINYGKDLYLGYPCYVGKDEKIAPLFIMKIQQNNNVLSVSVNFDTFIFNNEALKEMGVFSDMPRQFIEKISNSSSLPSDFFKIREMLLPFSYSVDWIDCTIQESSANNVILNQPILFRSDALLASYSRGLKKELTELSKIELENLKGTALSKILGYEIQNKYGSENPSIFEILDLNSEQEQAISESICNDISLITGPPGTGKSQIIAAFVVNACLNGKTVLIASKNNKAVDVVEDRINSLANRPFVMRQGGGHYLQKLNDYFGLLLQAIPNNHDFDDYEKLKSEYDFISQKILEKYNLINLIITSRNELDKEEQSIITLRNNAVLYTYVSNNYDPVELDKREKDVCSILSKINVKKSVFKRLSYWLFKKSRNEEYYSCIQQLANYCKDLGLVFDKTKTAFSPDYYPYYEDVGNQYYNAVNSCNRLHKYLVHLDNLSAMPGLPTIYLELGKLKKERIELAKKLWNKYLLVHFGNFNKIQREKIVDAKASITEAIAQGLYSVPFSTIVPVKNFTPCWAVTSLSAYGRIPLLPGFFDYVIIDESSQCDIPSALPLLYRAKKAIIVGDPNQLKHISAIKPQINNALMKRHNIEQQRFSYLSCSLYDLVSSVQTPFLIRNHYRCHPDIISFSNNYFYNGKLRIATNLSESKEVNGYAPGVEWIDVDGKAERPKNGSAYNKQEAFKIINVLEEIINSGFSGSIGVVSPFRAQINFIQNLIVNNAKISDSIERNQIVVDTAHKFQGDEKDVIIFSTVIAPGIPETCLSFLQEQKNVFNVAITRARSNLIIVGNLNYCGKTNVKFINDFTSYITTPIKKAANIISNTSPEQMSFPEAIFGKMIQDKGITVIPQYSACNYLLDFAVILNEKNKLDIEIDGEMYHKEWNGETVIQDIIRDNILEVNGWEIMRFWAYEVIDRASACINLIQEWIEKRKGE